MSVLAGTRDYPPDAGPKDVFCLQFWFEGFLRVCKQKVLGIVKL